MERNSHLFIVLEGLSAVGKSTISRLLAKELGGVYYQTPSDIFLDSREAVDKSASAHARFLYYLAGVVESSREIEEMLENQPVVCDRYTLSTLCYHRAAGLNVSIPDYLNLLQPDHTFLITCEQSVRLKRLRERGMTYNDKVERVGNLEERFMNEYRTFDPAEVSNTNCSPEETTKKILSLII